VTQDLQDFIRAYIAAVHQRFDEAVALDQKSITEADRAFFDGVTFCYQDALKILKQELEARGYDAEGFEPIVPEKPESNRVEIPLPRGDREIL